jgi:hypothetical protein
MVDPTSSGGRNDVRLFLNFFDTGARRESRRRVVPATSRRREDQNED